MAIKHELIQQWKKDEKTPFKGWDFSYLKGRIKEEKPTWNYISIAKKLIKKTNSVLDLATGGGEIFSEILSDFRPNRLIAIEGYKPNVSIAIRKLRKYGVKLIYANETRQLPFKESEFDLILNRHGGLNIKELTRIITEGGLFLTQQVGGDNLKDLIKEFGFSPKWTSNTLMNVSKELKTAGFRIKQGKKWRGKITFKDVGALVYFLKAIPWIIEGFNVSKYLSILEKLQDRLQRTGKLCFTSERFLIMAKKRNTYRTGRLLKPGGVFVFSVTHPCFHSSENQRFAEMHEGETGKLVIRTGVKVSSYLTPFAKKTEGIIGQPESQYCYHRPIQNLLQSCFKVGFVVDGFEEPGLPEPEKRKAGVRWDDMPEIPPVMVVRMTLR